MMIVQNWDYFPNFSRDEFLCKCGCGRAEMQSDFIDRLQQLRNRVEFPIVITSGFRCPDHNDAVSSTGRDGPHTTGRAADINIYGERAYRLLEGAFVLGFTGVGDKQHGPHPSRFIHLDTLWADETPGPRPWKWTY